MIFDDVIEEFAKEQALTSLDAATLAKAFGIGQDKDPLTGGLGAEIGEAAAMDKASGKKPDYKALAAQAYAQQEALKAASDDSQVAAIHANDMFKPRGPMGNGMGGGMPPQGGPQGMPGGY